MEKSPPLLHHVAIGTKNLSVMREFYLKLPGMEILREHYDEAGELRSTWYLMTHNIILMLEKKEKPKAPEALVFSCVGLKDIELLNELALTEKTKYSVYYSDPDGNKIGYSTYPEEIFYPFPRSSP